MLTNSEATALLDMDKHATDQREYDYPSLGGKLSVPLHSDDKKEIFCLDVTRGRIDLSKTTHQNRARGCVILLRLDINGPPHTNPDGTEMPCPHLHIYDENHADRIAYPVPPEVFIDLANPCTTLEDFMSYCNVITKPNILTGLFT